MNRSNKNENCLQDADADEFVIIGNHHLTSFNNWLCPETLHTIQVQHFSLNVAICTPECACSLFDLFALRGKYIFDS